MFPGILSSTVPGRDEDDAAGARHAGEAEQPQEDSVQNHRHVFPVVGHLGGTEMWDALLWGICLRIGEFKLFEFFRCENRMCLDWKLNRTNVGP